MVLQRRFALSTDGVSFLPGEFERELNAPSAIGGDLRVQLVSSLSPQHEAIEALTIANAFSYAFTESSGGETTDNELIKIAKTYSQYRPRNAELVQRNPSCFQALVLGGAEDWQLVAFTSVLPLTSEAAAAYQDGKIPDDQLNATHLAAADDCCSTLLLLAIGVAPIRAERFRDVGAQACLKYAVAAHVGRLLPSTAGDVAIVAQADNQGSSVAKLYKSMGMTMNRGYKTAERNPIWRVVVAVEEQFGRRTVKVRS